MTDSTDNVEKVARAIRNSAEWSSFRLAKKSKILARAAMKAHLLALMKPGEPAASIMLREMIRCVHNPQVNSGIRADAPEIVLRAFLNAKIAELEKT